VTLVLLSSSPASYPMGTGGVKQSGHKADHSLPSSAKVKNAWSYISTPPYVFTVWCLVKCRDNFTFTLYTSQFQAFCLKDTAFIISMHCCNQNKIFFNNFLYNVIFRRDSPPQVCACTAILRYCCQKKIVIVRICGA
jgi:hypothetical protein